MIKNKLVRQVLLFGVSGILATGSDYLLYSVLIRYYLGHYIIAKSCSFLLGTFVAFIFNKYVTFGVKQKSFQETVRFGILYTVSLVGNVAINKMSLMLLSSLDNLQYSIWLAFLMATAFSMVLNFLGQKFWVFKYK
jgi:putative flippase GtrA